MIHCITHHYEVANKQDLRYQNHNSNDCEWVSNFDPLTHCAQVRIDKDANNKIQNHLNKIIKNDDALVNKLVYVHFSAYTNNPINLGVMADSSEGKTYATTKVSEVFPKDDVITIGRMSPTALIHQRGILVDKNGEPIEQRLNELRSELVGKKKEEQARIKFEIKQLLEESKNLVILSGKTLLFLEPPNTQLWDLLKPILSHDKYEIEYKTTQTDGSLKVKETIIRGWPAVIFCSAKNEANDPIWREIETRFDIVSPNTAVTKYKEANKYTAQKLGMPSFASSTNKDKEEVTIVKNHVEQIKHRLLELCQNNQNPVWNPFHQIIGNFFPSNQGVHMRQCSRFLSYCGLSTLIHSGNRFIIHFERNNGAIQQYVISSIDDIDEAIDLMGTMSIIPPERLKFLHEVFEPTSAETLDDGLTTDVLATKFKNVYGKETTPKKILENYLQPLVSYGVLAFTDHPIDKRKNVYSLASKPNTNNLKSIRDKIIEQSNNDELFVWSGIIELEKCSIEEGKITKICDPNGYPEGSNLIQKQIIKSTIESNNITEEQT